MKRFNKSTWIYAAGVLFAFFAIRGLFVIMDINPMTEDGIRKTVVEIMSLREEFRTKKEQKMENAILIVRSKDIYYFLRKGLIACLIVSCLYSAFGLFLKLKGVYFSILLSFFLMAIFGIYEFYLMWMGVNMGESICEKRSAGLRLRKDPKPRVHPT